MVVRDMGLIDERVSVLAIEIESFKTVLQIPSKPHLLCPPQFHYNTGKIFTKCSSIAKIP
jgi:hypothetical protein